MPVPLPGFQIHEQAPAAVGVVRAELPRDFHGQVIRNGTDFVGFFVNFRLLPAQPGHFGAGEHGVDPHSRQGVDLLFSGPQGGCDPLVPLVLPHDGGTQRLPLLIHRDDAGPLGRQAQCVHSLPPVLGPDCRGGTDLRHRTVKVPRILLHQVLSGKIDAVGDGVDKLAAPFPVIQNAPGTGCADIDG